MTDLPADSQLTDLHKKVTSRHAAGEAVDFMDPDTFPELLNTQLALLRKRLTEARAKKEALRLEIKDLVKREAQWERAVKAFTAKEKPDVKD